MNRGIDHLVLPVHDLEAAAAAYRRMGFTTTPLAKHPWGTANALIQLEGSFLEHLSIAEPDKIGSTAPHGFDFGAFNRDFLLRGEGFSMLVFESRDAEADRQDFADKGLVTYPLFHFERQAKLPDGGTATVGFSLAFVTDPRMPEIAFFCCQQHAPQYFWKPEYQSHANGARACTAVFMAAPDPAALADFFQGLQGEAAVQRTEAGLTIHTERGRIEVLSPAAAARRLPLAPPLDAEAGPRFLGYQIGVTDLARTGALLSQAGVAHQSRNGALQIGPAACFGCCLEFAEVR